MLGLFLGMGFVKTGEPAAAPVEIEGQPVTMGGQAVTLGGEDATMKGEQ